MSLAAAVLPLCRTVCGVWLVVGLHTSNVLFVSFCKSTVSIGIFTLSSFSCQDLLKEQYEKLYIARITYGYLLDVLGSKNYHGLIYHAINLLPGWTPYFVISLLLS